MVAMESDGKRMASLEEMRVSPCMGRRRSVAFNVARSCVLLRSC